LSRQIKALVALAALALSLTAVAGCGGNDNNNTSTSTTATTATTNTATTPAPSASGGGRATLKLDADPSGALKFTKSTLQANAGTVTIVMGNPSATDHAIGIKGNGTVADGNTVGQGGTSKVTAKLQPGSYEFYCPVDAHEEAGMKGTLTVK
jgi:plastocyanin